MCHAQKQVSERMCHVQKQASERMRHVQKQAVPAHGIIRPARPKRGGEFVQKQAVSFGAGRMRPPRLFQWSKSYPRPADTLVDTLVEISTVQITSPPG